MITIYYIAKIRRSIQSSNNCSYMNKSKSNYLCDGDYIHTWSVHIPIRSYTQGKRFTSCTCTLGGVVQDDND